ncbi:MAG TPA: hypothetical protein VJ570_11180 [Holophagaceae bacterium]|nr:hypothetical protein [Holophagaceae bacterium]
MAASLSLYGYQSSVKATAQAKADPGTAAETPQAAVLQVLTSAYGSGNSGLEGLLPSTDSLSALAGADSLASLVGGIYTASTANGTNLPALAGLDPANAGATDPALAAQQAVQAAQASAYATTLNLLA